MLIQNRNIFLVFYFLFIDNHENEEKLLYFFDSML